MSSLVQEYANAAFEQVRSLLERAKAQESRKEN